MPKASALLQGIGAGVLFGTAAIFIRQLYGLDVISIAFGRLIVATAALFLMLLATRQRISASALKELGPRIMAMGILIGLHFLLFISAVKDTTILNATILVNTTPIFAMIFSVLVFRVRPSTASVLGVLMAFAGILALALSEAALGLVGNLQGDIEATAAALLEGLYLNIGREVRRRVPAIAAMLPIYLAASALILGAKGLSGAGLGIAESGPQALLSLIGLGLLPTAFGHTLYISSLSHLRAFQTATLALLEPIVATGLGFAIFGEVPHFQFVFGAAMILIGVFMVIRE